MFDLRRFRPPHVAVVLFIIISALHVFLTPPRLILPPYHWLGLVFGIDGLCLMVWARQLFKKNETSVRHSETPRRFVTDGPYRVTRNPMYVGAVSFLCGVAIYIGTWPFMLYPLFLFMILDRIYIPWEEETMLRLFGDEYQKYWETSRRWL